MSTQQTFRGRDLKEALARVKAALGEEALIVSSEHVRDGFFGQAVEVVAQPGESNIEQGLAAYAAVAAPEAPSSFERRFLPLEAEMRRLRAQLVSMVNRTGAVKSGHSTDGSSDTSLVSRLLMLGFPLETARSWSARLRQSKDPMTAIEKLVWDSVELGGPIAGNGARIIMCVGPSGAGKTTTIAKWAARAALEEGRRVLVITLDAFRAGAVEQLTRYTKLIGCELQAPRTNAELFSLLRSRPTNELILIDTAGRDPSAQHDLAAVANELRNIDSRAEVHLALPAMYGPRSLRAVIAQYRRFHINRLCFTKVDETHDFAPLASVIVADRLPLSYLTVGQRIPDDIELASADAICQRIVPSLVGVLCSDDIVVEERLV
jgi:flagellar biosynthesis protein FlhF